MLCKYLSIYSIVCGVCLCASASIIERILVALDTLRIGDLFSGRPHPESMMTTIQLIRSYGYPAERHTVVTTDGYMLEVHRIPHGKFNGTSVKRQAVLLLHGFDAGSSVWLVNGHRDSLGFVLSDEGYDVWLGNFRGNRYSRRHVTLSPKGNDFWQFSLDECAHQDLPSMIDYIRDKTGQEQIYLVGHSMGATSTVFLLSDNPEYNKKLKLAVLQAPVVYGRYLNNIYRLLGLYFDEFEALFQVVGQTGYLTILDVIRPLVQQVCPNYPGVVVCEILYYLIGGYNDDLLIRDRVHIYISHLLSGTSFNVWRHFKQLFVSNEAQKYDFGEHRNRIIYGQSNPVKYNISGISAPVVIFWGRMDGFHSGRDIERLAKEIGSLRSVEEVPSDLWAHGDFTFGRDARKHHYNRLLEVMNQVN